MSHCCTGNSFCFSFLYVFFGLVIPFIVWHWLCFFSSHVLYFSYFLCFICSILLPSSNLITSVWGWFSEALAVFFFSRHGFIFHISCVSSVPFCCHHQTSSHLFGVVFFFPVMCFIFHISCVSPVPFYCHHQTL